MLLGCQLDVQIRVINLMSTCMVLGTKLHLPETSSHIDT